MKQSRDAAQVRDAASADCERSLEVADLRTIFAHHRHDILRFLTRRTGNASTAADLSQDIFERLGAAQAPVPSPDKARSYIFRVASNLAIDHRRIESRRADILEGSQVLFEDTAPSPEDIAISRDQLRQVEQALEELPPKVVEVLILSRVHGMRHKDIAKRMQISVSLVEKYQLRALTHCRKRLEKWG